MKSRATVSRTTPHLQLKNGSRLVWFPKLKQASDFQSCGWLLIRIKGELPRLEAEIYNITSEQPVFQTARETNFTSVGNFRAILHGRPLVSRNNWMEWNTHLMWIWDQTQILALERSAWLSFGWNVTGNWGWLWLIILFWKDLRQVAFPDSFHGTAQVIHDLIQINSCFVQTSQAWWVGRGTFIKGGENNTERDWEWAVFLQRDQGMSCIYASNQEASIIAGIQSPE